MCHRKSSFNNVLLILSFILPAIAFAQDKRLVSLSSADELSAYTRWHIDLEPRISAHRGGPEPGWPENAIETFDNALTYAPCIIECDVSMTKDSVLVMMHDNTLDRTTTGSGPVSEATWEELQGLYLIDNDGDTTDFRIPLFEDVLTWAVGRAVLTVDVKRGVPPERIVFAVQNANAQGHSVIITYNKGQAATYNALDPSLVLSVGIYDYEDYEQLRAEGIPDDRMVAFVGVGTNDPETMAFLHDHGISCILGTMGDVDKLARREGASVYVELYEAGLDILSTDEVPIASKALHMLKDMEEMEK